MPPKKRAQPAVAPTVETTRLETGFFDLLANPERLGSPRQASESASSDSEKSVRSERSARSARSARSEKSARSDKSAKSDRSAKSDKSARSAKSGRSAKSEKAHERARECVAQIDDVRPRTETERQRVAYVKLQRFASMPGAQMSRTFKVTDAADDLEAEVLLQEAILRDRLFEQRTDDSLRFARKMLLAFTSFTEFMNKRYDPFGIDISGWSDSVMESITDYDRPFKKLIQKYRGTAEMAPELELVVTLGSSMFMFHLSKSLAARMAADMPRVSPKRRRARTQVAVSDASSDE
jgi:hypothetical protein